MNRFAAAWAVSLLFFRFPLSAWGKAALRIRHRLRRMSAQPRALRVTRLRPLVEDAHGERRPRSEGPSGGHHPGLHEARPAGHLHQDQVAFAYGSKWKQRYFTKVGDDYFPLGAQWDVTHKQWRLYRRGQHRLVGAALSGRQRSGRPAAFDGCHSVNYNVQTKPVASGTSAARSATGRQASTPRSRRGRTSQPGGATPSTPTTRASSATHRGSRSPIRSPAGTTTGLSASASD